MVIRPVDIALSILVGHLGCGFEPGPPGDPEPQGPSAAEIFTDRAPELGLDFTHFNGMSGRRYLAEIIGPGGAFLDYDADGDLDAYLVQGAPIGEGIEEEATSPSAGAPSDRLFRNHLEERGYLSFSDATAAAGIAGAGYGMGVAAGDFTNDGLPDLYVTNFGPNQMLRNNGDGTFTDVTLAAAADDRRWSTSATFVDYDGDGWLDLYVGNYVDFSPAAHKSCYSPAGAEDYCGPLTYRPYPDRLLRNRGDGSFDDVSAFSRITTEYGGALGVIAADFSGDDWPDIYVANDGMANQLWINRGDGRFDNQALLSGTAFNAQGIPEGSMGIDAGDMDGDGDDDLFMTHLAEETNTLYRNQGGAFFEDDTIEAGLGAPSRGFTGFGTAYLDYDNDGWLDLLAVNGAVRVIEALVQAGDPLPLHQTNQLFRNRGKGRFEEVSSAAGAVFALSEVSRGAAFGDVDNDGDTDVLVLNNSGPARLLVNNVGQRNAYLGLRLVGGEGGRDQFGARVGCTLGDGRTLWRRVRADGSYCSSNDPRVLFGLGTAATVRRLDVLWPDGTRERWDGSSFDLNRYHTLERGSGLPLP